MSRRKILVTRQDMDRLRDLLRKTRDPLGMERPYLETLSAELDRAQVVPIEGIDPDVVTMNTTVRVRDRDSGRLMEVTLVYPERATLEADHISVLAPLGAALLGYRVGDDVSFEVPRGRCSYEIVEVMYQPEAAGDLHL